MRHHKLSKLVILEEEGKLNAEDYCSQILDNELFDFWITSMGELSNVLVMEDGAPYHKGAASVRREQLKKDGWIG